MRSFLTCLLLFPSFLFSQHFSYPSINKKGQQIKDFIPAGWVILDSASGDLNNDHLNDISIILQHKDSLTLINAEEDTVITQPRILIILLKTNSGNSFQLTEQSNSFILEHDNSAMDDPFLELTIINGILEIRFHLFYNIGGWYTSGTSYKFRYQEGEFALIGADHFSIHRATLDFVEYSFNFLTKKRSLTKGNDNTGKKKTTWKSLNIYPLKSLKTFTKPFTWEIEPDLYL